jgi:cytoskeletal protein CcmA (bactofilin family)
VILGCASKIRNWLQGIAAQQNRVHCACGATSKPKIGAKIGAPNVCEVQRRRSTRSIAQQQQSLTVAKSAKRDTDAQISTIGRGVTIVGKILSEGTVDVLGQIEGEPRALTVSINEGAKVEGEIVAEELTVGGMVKGSIRANRVKLSNTAVVEGDIFHRSLLIEENAHFEGSSKRQDNASDLLRTLPDHAAAPGKVATQAKN